MLSRGEGLYTVDQQWFKSSNGGITFQSLFIIIIITTNRYISPLFNAMCLMKWSRLYRPFSTSAILSSVTYTQSLSVLQDALDHFHQHCEIFWTSSICPNGFNLPWSNAAVHYLQLIQELGAPNGLCSSIMELKHIKVVKEPWWWSGCWDAIKQMLTTNTHLNKLAAAWVNFVSHGMLEGMVLDGILSKLGDYHSWIM